MAHSDDATKKLEKAIPTTNSDGKVVKWDITYSNYFDYYVYLAGGSLASQARRPPRNPKP